MIKSISKQSGESVESVLKKKTKAAVGSINVSSITTSIVCRIHDGRHFFAVVRWNAASSAGRVVWLGCSCWNTYLVAPGVIWIIAAPVLVTIVVSHSLTLSSLTWPRLTRVSLRLTLSRLWWRDTILSPTDNDLISAARQKISGLPLSSRVSVASGQTDVTRKKSVTRRKVSRIRTRYSHGRKCSPTDRQTSWSQCFVPLPVRSN